MSSRLEPRPRRAVSDLAQGASPPAFAASQVLEKLPALPEASTALAAEWAELARETDPEFFFAGLRGLAGRAQLEGRLEWAAATYAEIAAHPLAGPEAARARTRLDAILGRGAFGGRFEVLASRFVRDATDYRTIVPMLAGSAVFRLVSGAALGRLLATADAAWYQRGLGARFAAGLLGFAAEVPVFSLSSRGLRAWSGEPVAWDSQSVSRDLLGTALTLGALKGADFLGRRALAGLSGPAAWLRRPLLQQISQAMVPQATMFLGLMAAHRLEEGLGLRPHSDGATATTDALASMLSLGVGERLGQRLLGSRYAQWQAELELRMSQLSVSQGTPGLSFEQPVFAVATQPPRNEASLATFPARPDFPAMLSETSGHGGHGSKPALELRAYQREYLQAATAAMRRATEAQSERSDPRNPQDRGYILSPFQTGKSLIIGPLAEAAREIFPGKRTLVLSPLKIVQRQIREDLTRTFSGKVSVFDAQEKNLDGEVVVASVFSLAKFLERSGAEFPAREFGLVVIDEMTSVLADSWQRILRELGFVDTEGTPRSRAGRFALGLGGTGEREDGRHVREFFGPTFLAGQGLNWFVREGYLHDVAGLEVPYGKSEADFERLEDAGESLVVMRNTPENRKRILDTYAEHLSGKRAMVFVESVQHAEDLAADFNARFGPGYAAAVTGKSSDGHTETALDRFDRGDAKVLVSVRKLAIGFRARETHGILHGYQTTSWNLFAQRSSRALARQPGEPQREVMIITMEGGLKPLAGVQTAATLFGNYDGYPRGQKYRPMDETTPEPQRRGQLRLHRGLFAGGGRRDVNPPQAAKFFAQELRGILRRQFAGDLLRMCEVAGIPLHRGDGMLQGALPETKAEVETLADSLGVEVSISRLVEAWLRDRLAALELQYPLSESTSPARKALTQLVRKAVLLRRESDSQSVFSSRLKTYFRGEFSAEPQDLADLQQILEESQVADPEVIRAVLDDFLEEQGFATEWLHEVIGGSRENDEFQVMAHPLQMGISSASLEAAEGPERALELAWKWRRMREALPKLDPSDRELLMAHYGLTGESGETLSQLGQKFGLSGARMGQKENDAIVNLRVALRLGHDAAAWNRGAEASVNQAFPLDRLGLSSVSRRVLAEQGVRGLSDLKLLPGEFFETLGKGSWFIRQDVIRARNRIALLSRVLPDGDTLGEYLRKLDSNDFEALQKMCELFSRIRDGYTEAWKPLVEAIRRRPTLGALILRGLFDLRRAYLGLEVVLFLRFLAAEQRQEAKDLLSHLNPTQYHDRGGFSWGHPYAAFIIRLLADSGNLEAKKLHGYYSPAVRFLGLPTEDGNWETMVWGAVRSVPATNGHQEPGYLIWPQPLNQYRSHPPALLGYDGTGRRWVSFLKGTFSTLSEKLSDAGFKPAERKDDYHITLSVWYAPRNARK